MIICGYCETQNNNDNFMCVACGGSLVDDISSRRNLKEIEPIQSGVTIDEAYNALRQMFG